MTANGSNFVPSSTILWNGQPRTPLFVSPTQLQRPVSATDIASAGTIPVTVVNPPPGGGTAAANFTILPPFVLSVVRGGNGSGAVTSAPGGIACGATRSARFASGPQVVLTAAADASSAFTGWSGCDSVSTNKCSITLTSTKTVAATFAAPPGSFALVVTLRGSAGGTVASNPSGISCGSSCAQLFTSNTQVRLSAAPAPGEQFKGWGGACSNTSGDSVVTMNAAQQVWAVFSAAYSQSALTPMSTHHRR